MIFQDPYASLDPRLSIRDSIAEPLAVQGIGNEQERRERVDDLMEKVGLPRDVRRRGCRASSAAASASASASRGRWR